MTHNTPHHQSDSPPESDSPPSAPAHEYSCAASLETARESDGFRIESATLADLERIVAIDQASFSQPWAPRTFQDALQDDKSLVLVARVLNRDRLAAPASPSHEYSCNAAIEPQADEAQTVGQAFVCAFGVATIVSDEAEIATLAVALEARGHGLGERLLRALMRLCVARGACRVFLEVRPSNAKARHLYERSGFFECGRRRNYYADGEDALILRADCDQSPAA